MFTEKFKLEKKEVNGLFEVKKDKKYNKDDASSSDKKRDDKSDTCADSRKKQ